ncbi:MAG: radical SAM protein [Thermoplasmata archaeon]|nr:radical SAM protein [Thermoplasmata archaeon]
MNQPLKYLVTYSENGLTLYLNPATAHAAVIKDDETPENAERILHGRGLYDPPKTIPPSSYGLLEITHACNLRCTFCDANAAVRGEDELTFDEIRSIVDKMRECGIHVIALTGGEPLLREDALDILKYIKESGANTVLTTNSILMTDNIAKRLLEMETFVQVGLDGSSPQTNDPVRGEGSFKKTMEGIRILSGHKVPFRLSTVITKYNYEDINNITKLASDMGATGVTFRKMNILGRAMDNASSAPSDAQFVKVGYDIFLDTIRYGGKMRIQFPYQIAIFEGRGTMCNKIICLPARSNCVVSPEGDIFPCHSLREDFFLGNIRTDDLCETWNTSKIAENIRELDIESIKCRSCRYKYLCGGGCRAEAYYHRGDITDYGIGCEGVKKYYDTILSAMLKMIGSEMYGKRQTDSL